MVDFRYAQFCPLTRAVEILGERWTILILRELFPGPKRFSDLKSALNGVSPSVLADRLVKLEERGVILKRVVPPAATAIYELDDAGRALAPVLADLTRWGVRFLGAPDPRDRVRPEWLLLGFRTFARAGRSESIGAKLHVEDATESVDIYVRGGDGGTTVSLAPTEHDVTIRSQPMEMMLFANGMLAPDALSWEGDLEVARRIPALFDFSPAEAVDVPSPAGATIRRIAPAPASEQPRSARRPRRGSRPAAPGDRYSTDRIPTGGDPS